MAFKASSKFTNCPLDSDAPLPPPPIGIGVSESRSVCDEDHYAESETRSARQEIGKPFKNLFIDCARSSRSKRSTPCLDALLYVACYVLH